MSKDNKYIDVAPVPGAILIISGDILEFLSNGYYQATLHQVVPSPNPKKKGHKRQSIVYFMHPDLDTKYTYVKNGQTVTVTAEEHINGKFYDSFGPSYQRY